MQKTHLSLTIITKLCSLTASYCPTITLYSLQFLLPTEPQTRALIALSIWRKVDFHFFISCKISVSWGFLALCKKWKARFVKKKQDVFAKYLCRNLYEDWLYRCALKAIQNIYLHWMSSALNIQAYSAFDICSRHLPKHSENILCKVPIGQVHD